MARPSKYTKDTAMQAEKLCKLGATDKELADFFGVSESTLNRWKEDHSEFWESIKKGKLLADATVADSLYQRAVGYQHPEDDIKVVAGEIVITPTTKHYPPDPVAGIFWLTNRQRGKWSRSPAPETPQMLDIKINVVRASKDER